MEGGEELLDKENNMRYDIILKVKMFLVEIVMGFYYKSYQERFSMKGNASCYALHVCAVLAVLVLAGCAPLDWIKEKFGGKKAPAVAVIEPGKDKVSAKGKIEPAELKGRGDKVLVTMEGVPVMTIKSFEEEFEKLIEENPQLKQMAQFIPNLKENIFKSLRSQLVMDAYIEREGIDQDPEYQADLARFIKSLKRMLNSKYFAKGQSVTVSDAEVKKFYDENKDKVPGLIVSQGGIRAVGVKFDTEPAAKAFFDKVKGKSKQFDELANADKLSVQDFKLVNDQSLGMNAELRKKVMGIKSFPVVDMVKAADNEYWVVNATAKEAKQYRPYEEVREPLKSDLEREKEMKAVEAAVEKLESKYNIIVDEEAFKIIAPPAPEPQQAAEALIPDSPAAPKAQQKVAQEAPRSARAA